MITSLGLMILPAFAAPLDHPQEARTKTEHLSQHPALVSFSQQAWGELGLDACAHVPGQKGLPLQIGERRYAHGLGHHASGEIIVELDGEYERFECEVGVQPLPGCAGTVRFKVYVDDQLAFDSGVMKGGQPAKTLSVELLHAMELRLEADDAGDGITCDCANWAEARLTRAAQPSTRPAERPALDVAMFARVVTSDPARMNGCRAGRTEEFAAEDVYLERDLPPDASGSYAVAPAADGRRAIGLRWLERRRLRELTLEGATDLPASVEGVQLQFWQGESAWQGRWQPLQASIQSEGRRLCAQVDWRGNPELRLGTRRVRWILPAGPQPAVISSLTALSTTPLMQAELRVECDPLVLGDAGAGTRLAEIGMYNGAFIEPAGRGAPPRIRWNYRTGEPLTLRLLASRPRRGKPDRTVLEFKMPNGAFGVAVDDVLAQGQVYVKPFGLFVARAADGPRLADYRRQILKREPLLEEVRRAPDQTLAAATAKIHHPVQNKGPTMLSLACDNRKFVVHRNGLLQFPAVPEKAGDMQLYPPKGVVDLHMRAGSGQDQQVKRALEGGWLPVVLTEFSDANMKYRQRVCVVPMDELPLPEQGWLSEHPLCVAELTAENPGDSAANATWAFRFAPSVNAPAPALREVGPRILATLGERVAACFEPGEQSTLRAEIRGSELVLSGALAGRSSARWLLYLPGWSLPIEEQARITGGSKLFARVRPYWERVLAPAARIKLPDPLLSNLVKASQVHCLIAARNEADGRRIAPWIASFHYGPLESEANSIIAGLDYLGHHEFARRSHDYFIHRYNPAGYLTTGYTVMGTGWQVWTLGRHYELTRDTEWLRRVAPEVARVCNWILRQREKTRQLDAFGRKPPEYGLMPPGVMADWNAYAYHFCLNAYYHAALQSAGTALADINHPDAKRWLSDAAEFREEIIRAYRWTQARYPVNLLRDGTAVPGYPSQVHSPGPLNYFFPGEDGNRSWCYDVELGAHHLVPLGVLDADSRDVTWMMNHHEDEQFLADGWFDFPAERNRRDPYNLGGFAKVQPYYCRNAEIYALRGDVKPFVRAYLNTIPSLLNFENLSFQEHFAGAGAWNKTHETGYFLHQTRLMLIQERDRELWLAPFVSSHWMAEGHVVSIEGAPTQYGPAGFRIVSSVGEGRIEATIQPPQRSLPEAIVLTLRHPQGQLMKSVLVNGAAHSDFDPERELIRLRAQPNAISVKARY